MSVEKSTIDRFGIPRARRPRTAAAPRAAAADRPAAWAGPADGAAGVTREAAPPARSVPTAPVPGSAALRAGFAALEHQPRLGGWLAERLWFRLPAPASVEARGRHTPSGGEPFEVQWEAGTVRGRAYGDWGLPTAYLVHGWGGWWQQLGAHVQPLLDRGLCVVAFDSPSHGDSSPGRFGPRSTTFPEMAQALSAVVADFG